MIYAIAAVSKYLTRTATWKLKLHFTSLPNCFMSPLNRDSTHQALFTFSSPLLQFLCSFHTHSIHHSHSPFPILINPPSSTIVLFLPLAHKPSTTSNIQTQPNQSTTSHLTNHVPTNTNFSLPTHARNSTSALKPPPNTQPRRPRNAPITRRMWMQ
jgi:hypothetical protein